MLDEHDNKLKLLEKELDEKKQMMTELQRLAVPTVLFATYTHEMSSKLSMLSMLLTLHLEVCRKQGIEEHVDEIIREFESLRLMNQSLSSLYSRRPSAKTVSLENCISECSELVKPMLAEARIILYTEIALDARNLRIPKQDFLSILLNLLGNAIKALQSIHNRKRIIKVSATYDQELMILTIEDNGYGIHSGTIASIWQPGFSTVDGQTGIGLYLVRHTVESLGGRITAKSELGQFTQFTITLPTSTQKLDENATLD